MRTHNLNNIMLGKVFAFLLLCFCNFDGKAQTRVDTIYSFAPPDSEFVMTIARYNGQILIGLSFPTQMPFDYLTIERKAAFDANFSRFKYITFDDAKAQKWHLIKRDVYPYPGAVDVQYRIKYVTKDGVMRSFPSILLPAVKE
ncbi:MAG: hypothetical protein JWO06_2181 [Bacteroidota bacterium]|nr:hypothetical protein [Bacteroidota bacterium]